jgi:hypothetical protein
MLFNARGAKAGSDKAQDEKRMHQVYRPPIQFPLLPPTEPETFTPLTSLDPPTAKILSVDPFHNCVSPRAHFSISFALRVTPKTADSVSRQLRI